MSRPVTDVEARAFINDIAQCAQYAYKQLGKVLPSVCIGMACVESGYGTAGSCKYHSYLGHKVGTGKTATKYWNGTYFNSTTGEEYTVGVHTSIKANFRTYESMQQCVLNYYELLNSSLYNKVLPNVDYETQMKQIKLVGYMTSSTEVNSVLSIIKKYNLTQYDPKPTTETPSKFFRPCSYDGKSIVEALNSIGVTSTFAYRSKIAAANNIYNYGGSANENERMLSLLKAGELVKP